MHQMLTATEIAGFAGAGLAGAGPNFKRRT
jgi:hypothetical protein